MKWLSVIGHNVADLEALQGKKIGIAMGTGSEIFWRRVVEKRGWKVADFTMVNVEAPEMLAATERGDIDGFAVWEPWPTRTLMAVKGTKVLQTAEGIYNNINFVYMNRGWIEKNEDTGVRFIRALVEANDLIGKDRPAATAMVSKFLKMPIELTRELMPKMEYDMNWRPRSLGRSRSPREAARRPEEAQGAARLQQVRLHRPPEAVRPQNVQITSLPK